MAQNEKIKNFWRSCTTAVFHFKTAKNKHSRFLESAYFYVVKVNQNRGVANRVVKGNQQQRKAIHHFSYADGIYI